MQWVLALFLLAFGMTSARAQAPAMPWCNGYDSAVVGTTALPVLINCPIVAGPTGVVYVAALGQTTCTGTEGLQLLYKAGSPPANIGASFTGSISGGTLTVTALATPFVAPWLIQTGQTLYDSGASFTATTITGQTGSTETGGALGGRGTYSVANPAISFASSPTLYSNAGLASGMTALTPTLHQNSCNTQMQENVIPGSFLGTPGTAYWFALTLVNTASGAVATWTNHDIKAFTY